MKVETYEAISVDDPNGAMINEEVSEEALALIETLKLEGQRELLSERSVGTNVVVKRNPYRKMTAEESAIFGAILPRRVELAQYSDGPIPLRVLQIAAHATELFGKIVVWCPAEPHHPDPLLVGLQKEDWRETPFILARWGDVLEPLDALREKAKRIILTKLRAEIAKNRAAITRFEASIEERLDNYLVGGPDESEFLTSLNFR